MLPDTDNPAEVVARQQRRAADPAISAGVMANAGSGKTKVLIDRVARLLLRQRDGRPGAAPDSILCITYTRAAANEMLTRLFQRLGKWALMPDSELRQELGKLEGREGFPYTADALKEARQLFARALETPGGLRIETIHAFCARVLRRFPLEAGVMPGFAEIDEAEQRRIWQQAKTRAIEIAAEQMPDVLDALSVEAGGSGALDVVDLMLTASMRSFAVRHDGSADAMIAALRRELCPPNETPEALLDQAMQADLPRTRLVDVLAALEALEPIRPTDAKLADALRATLAAGCPKKAWAAYRDIFFTDENGLRKRNPYTVDAQKRIPDLSRLFQCQGGEGSETARMRHFDASYRTAVTFTRTAHLLRVGMLALAEYEKLKAERGAVDFDDLITLTRRMLQADGMVNWVLYKLDGGLSHVLIDEAQDTSPEQWALVRALTSAFEPGDPKAEEKGPRTLFIVGDEKQSIYSFQGADPANLLKEIQRLTDIYEGAPSVPLTASFRSTPQILSFVEAVWTNAPTIEIPENETPPMTATHPDHRPVRTAEPGEVQIWPVVRPPDEPDTDPWDRPLDALPTGSPKLLLARQVAKEIRRMIDAGEPVWEAGRVRPIAPQDVLILVTKRKGGLFEALIRELKLAGLPVAGADRLVLTKYIGVQDCLNLMRFALLPERDLTLAEILRGPFGGLADDDRYLYPLAAARAPRETLWDRVRASCDPDVRAFASFLGELVSARHLPAHEFLSRILDRPIFAGQTGWERLIGRLGPPARDPVEALLSRALSHDAASPASLQAFLASMEGDDVEIRRDLAEAGRDVRIMTVHGAKGLEAPVVFLPDTTGRPETRQSPLLMRRNVLLWSTKSCRQGDAAAMALKIESAKAREEHRRLLYVALTRARDRLIIAGHWSGSTGLNAKGYHEESWYADCLAGAGALDPKPREAGVWRYGGRFPPISRSATRVADPERDALPDWAITPAAQRAVSQRYVAPSGLVAAKAPALAPFDAARESRLRRGRLIHALLQWLPGWPAAERQKAGEDFLARDPSLSPEARAEMLAAALSVIQGPDTAALFASGGRSEAPIIGTAPDLPAGMVINGRVDRLIVAPDKVLIIDFKTDQPAPPDIHRIAPDYLVQMACYRAVLSVAYPGREVRAALCWTDGPRLMWLPSHIMDAALAGMKAAV